MRSNAHAPTDTVPWLFVARFPRLPLVTFMHHFLGHQLFGPSTELAFGNVLLGECGCGSNQWYHFGIGAPPNLAYVSGCWDVHWGYGFLTHGHMGRFAIVRDQTLPPKKDLCVGHAVRAPCLQLTMLNCQRDPGVYLQPVDKQWFYPSTQGPIC